MSPELMTAILLVGFLALLVIGAEMYVAMGLASLVGLVFFIHKPLQQLAWSSWDQMNSFALTAVPLFVFMGALFANTGVARSIFIGAEKLLSGLPGSLFHTIIGANALFGAMCGSSIAAAAAFTTICFAPVEERGYDPKLALGTIAVGGTLSSLIPPSILLIVYGGWWRVSVVHLFAAALIPGILITLLLMVTVMVLVKIRPNLAPPVMKSTWGEKLSALRDLFPWLILIVLILGVIFAGIMTPTEAAALGAFMAIIFALLYRRMSFKALKISALGATKTTAMITLILVTASVLGYVFQALGATDAVAALIMKAPFGKAGILVSLVLMYLILGCFVSSMVMMMTTFPFVMPIIEVLNFSPVWWGVTFVILAEIGMVTPPFGLNLFVVHSEVRKYSILAVSQGALPFLVPLMVGVILLIIFPQISLWLPGLLF